jgi:hypothetical protein
MISRYLKICVLILTAATFFPSDLVAQGTRKCDPWQKGKQCMWDNRTKTCFCR